MWRTPLTGTERETIVVLCEAALKDRNIPPAYRLECLSQFTAEDFERCESIISKLAEDEPIERYTPPGGRL